MLVTAWTTPVSAASSASTSVMPTASRPAPSPELVSAPLAPLARPGHVVRRQQDRPPGPRRLPLANERPDHACRAHVEAERRLVQEEDPRGVEEAPGQVHLLPLAGRQGRGPPV